MAVDLKYGQLDIPGLGDDEPVFIIRGRDTLAAGVLDEYVYFADEAGLESVADGVNAVKNQFAAWQAENGDRLPG